MHRSLLVVDWDYFFRNPIEGAPLGPGENYGLYDWGHNENSLMIDVIWTTRSLGFLANDLPLPSSHGWREFPSRFNLSDEAVIYVADSNAWAGNLSDSEGDPFSDVWLYDAHHDSGYNVKTFAEWMARHVTDRRTSFSCEDWMLIHHLQGSALHWRYPMWHEEFERRLATGECDADCDHPGVAHGAFWPEGVVLDAAMDDLQPHPEEFDTVFICRSGAWVPPWCDDDFEEFVSLWPGDLEQLDTDNLNRGFDLDRARLDADAYRRVLDGVDEMTT